MKVIEINNFSDWKFECSSFKFKKQDVRPMLNNIEHIKAVRGFNSTKYDDYCPLKKLDFLKVSTLKMVCLNLLKEKNFMVSILQKKSILKILVPLMPKNRREFWTQLATLEEAEDFFELTEA